MSITRKLIVGLLMCSMLLPITTIKAETNTYNTPNTTSEDTDKKSECEVTADIHYAYYISLPAALTLEPYDEENVKSEFGKYFYHSNFFTGYVESINQTLNTDFFQKDMYMCNYQIKARAKSGGLGNKMIVVIPTEDPDDVEYEGTEGTTAGALFPFSLINTEIVDYTDYSKYGLAFVLQDKWGFSADRYFYQPPESNKRILMTEIVDSQKWSVINGVVIAAFGEQGLYKGNFNFVYGLGDR